LKRRFREGCQVVKIVDNGQMPILSVRELKTYFFQDEGIVRAVDGASFDVHAQRTLGIVGESGCGKRVTARSILRIVERPGRILEGEIREMRSIRGDEIALIFQEPMTSFSAHYTVGNQIVEMVQLHQKVSKQQARERAIEVLNHVGVPQPERRIDEYAFQLSGGLRQRVMIAMALSCDPRILIADEPTTALDVTTQAQILDLLRDLQKETGMAVMLITHNMGVIAEMADDVVVMYLGRVVEVGPVDSIFHASKHPYTQALLRSIPSVLSDPRSKLPTITGAVPHPYNRPSGCPFYPRCTDFMRGLCDVQKPDLLPVEDGHAASCFLYHGA
jgi:oligopeptide/dipeptide ABC transporter ATP-binding protein